MFINNTDQEAGDNMSDRARLDCDLKLLDLEPVCIDIIHIEYLACRQTGIRRGYPESIIHPASMRR